MFRRSIKDRLSEPDFRAVDTSTLAALMQQAEGLKLSGKGRPVWINNRRNDLDRVVVSALLIEASPITCIRCRVIVVYEKGVAQFLLDVLPQNYFSLKKLKGSALARLAADLAGVIPHLPFDHNQK